MGRILRSLGGVRGLRFRPYKQFTFPQDLPYAGHCSLEGCTCAVREKVKNASATNSVCCCGPGIRLSVPVSVEILRSVQEPVESRSVFPLPDVTEQRQAAGT